MYTRFLITILTVLSFMAVAYCKFAEPQTIEPFAGLGYPPFGAQKQPTISNGETCTDVYQFSGKQSPLDTLTAVVPTNLNNMAGYYKVAAAVDNLDGGENFQAGGSNNVPTYSNTQDEHFAQQGGQQFAQQDSQQFAQQDSQQFAQQGVAENFQQTDGLNNPGCIQEGYTGPNNFYTVPGTFQSELSPRFMNEGFGADITYNFPEQKFMAAEPDNPLSLANDVENFEQQVQENYENVETKFAQVHEPIPLPKTMDGPTREEYGSGSPAAVPQFKTYDRLITTTGQRTGQTNQYDRIRGDLPILPSTESCGWFQSRYANPQYLGTGALAVLGGASNNTDAMASLKVANTADTTGSGGKFSPAILAGPNSIIGAAATDASKASGGSVGAIVTAFS